MGFTRRQLLAALGSSALLTPFAGRAQANAPTKNLVVVWANGGWDTTFVFDPKLDSTNIEGPEVDATGGSDVEAVEVFGTDLPIVVNDEKRPSVSAFFRAYGDRCAVVNGINTGSVAHDPSRSRVLTGTGAPGRADISVIAGSVHGVDRPLGSIDMSGFSFAGPLGATAGRIGTSSQLKSLVDPTSSFEAPASLGQPYPLFVPTSDNRTAIQAVLDARAERLRNDRGGAEANDQKLDDLAESVLRAERLVESGSDTIGTLTLGKSPGFLASMPLAVEFLSKGVCSTVFIDTSARWDTHTNNSQQHDLFESLFAGLNELARLLDEAGRLDDTVVLVLSEMTRTPKINTEKGKDHWPYTSALAFGAGVKGGRTFGGTNDQLEALPIDFATGDVTNSGRILEYDAFAASMLELLDVDPEPWFGDLPTFTGWKA